jgi:hypothetical protein
MELRIKSGFDIVNVDGHYVIKGEKSLNQTIILDEISLFLWNNLKDREFTKNEMLELLLNKFEISTVLALGEIDKFVRILRENEIIE